MEKIIFGFQDAINAVKKALCKISEDSKNPVEDIAIMIGDVTDDGKAVIIAGYTISVVKVSEKIWSIAGVTFRQTMNF